MEETDAVLSTDQGKCQDKGGGEKEGVQRQGTKKSLSNHKGGMMNGRVGPGR